MCRHRYAAYAAAESVSLSGIMALFFCGIMMSHYCWCAPPRLCAFPLTCPSLSSRSPHRACVRFSYACRRRCRRQPSWSAGTTCPSRRKSRRTMPLRALRGSLRRSCSPTWAWCCSLASSVGAYHPTRTGACPAARCSHVCVSRGGVWVRTPVQLGPGLHRARDSRVPHRPRMQRVPAVHPCQLPP